MERLALEVSDIFLIFCFVWRQSQQGHLSLGQLKVMSAIEQCRSAALGDTFGIATAAIMTK